MIIETKYEIGHTFWAPRCYKRFEQEKLVWDGEEWYRNVPYFEAVAKQKEIVAIHAGIKKDGEWYIQYGCIDFGQDTDQLSSWYGEKAITEYTEEQALEIAQQYADKQKEYVGN